MAERIKLELSQEELDRPLADYYREPRAKMLAEWIDKVYPSKPKYWTLDRMLASVQADMP
jgi:hypothetical protein